MFVSCICGKLCTSKAGLVLHQRMCDKACDAIKAGLPTTHESHIQPYIDYHQNIKCLINIVSDIANDADKALKTGNKSAGRRSRVKLLELRDMIIPLRDEILNNMKNNN
jgi:hypothetical protein